MSARGRAALDRRRKANLLAFVLRRRDREALVVNFWALGPRCTAELLEHLDRELGIGAEIDTAVRRALGWPRDLDPTPIAAGSHGHLALLRNIEARRLQQGRRAEALHRLGSARLLAIVHALDSAAVDAAELFMRRVLALSREAIRVAGADQLVPLPIRRVW
jgi:hypothetical protein